MTARPRTAYTAALASALASAALLTSCTGASRQAAQPDDGARVIAPGEPGRTSGTVSVEEAREAGDKQRRPNGADFRFMTMMVEHHRQALTMTDLAERHTSDGTVGKLAERIETAQRPEIATMRAWLKRNDAEGRAQGAEGHDHAAMPGMATEEQLGELRAARGADFDELFLTLMATHHRGAVTMAEDVLADGNDVTVEEMATEMAAQQSAEVARMRTLD